MVVVELVVSEAAVIGERLSDVGALTSTRSGFLTTGGWSGGDSACGPGSTFRFWRGGSGMTLGATGVGMGRGGDVAA